MAAIFRKYWHLFAISAKQRHVYLFGVVASLFSYAIRIFLIVTLFRYLQIHSPGSFSEYSVSELSWGIVFAQIATIAVPNISWHVSEDIKSWKVAVYLLNPVSYPVFKAFETLSGIFADTAVLSILAIAIGAAFIGVPAVTAVSVFSWMVLLFGAFALLSLIQIQIGLFAFLVEEVSPIRWIVFKANMLLGGNILPISFMPGWLQSVAFASPFAYTGYVAGLTFARFDAESFVRYVSVQWFWIVLLYATISLSFARFSRRLTVHWG